MGKAARAPYQRAGSAYTAQPVSKRSCCGTRAGKRRVQGFAHRESVLDGYCVSGDGPAFHRFGNRVRYRRADLDAWAARRRATTTAEADRLGAR